MSKLLAIVILTVVVSVGCETQADKDRRANAEMQFQTTLQNQQNELCRKLDAAIVDHYTLQHPGQAPTKANLAKLRAYENQELAKSNCRLGEVGTFGEHEAFSIPESERTTKDSRQ